MVSEPRCSPSLPQHVTMAHVLLRNAPHSGVASSDVSSRSCGCAEFHLCASKCIPGCKGQLHRDRDKGTFVDLGTSFHTTNIPLHRGRL